jgi:hypothetical protein
MKAAAQASPDPCGTRIKDDRPTLHTAHGMSQNFKPNSKASPRSLLLAGAEGMAQRNQTEGSLLPG